MKASDLNGYFVNLDRSAERRSAMDAALRRHGLDAVTRFPAIEGDGRTQSIGKGELGCFLSHQAILEGAEGDRPLLLMEDDLVLPDRFGDYLAIALERAAGVNWDILFLTQMISFTDLRSVYQLIRKKRSLGNIHAPDFDRFSIEECKGFYVSSTGAYVVRPGGRSKVLSVLRDAAAQNYPKPIDITYMQAINSGKINAKFVFPYILGVNSRFGSTVSAGREGEHKALLFNDILNLFVAGGDSEHLMLRAHQAAHSVPFDPDAFVATQILYRRMARPD